MDSKVSPCAGDVAAPMERVTDIPCPFPSRSGMGVSAVVRRTVSANVRAASASMPGSRMTNSSPA